MSQTKVKPKPKKTEHDGRDVAHIYWAHHAFPCTAVCGTVLHGYCRPGAQRCLVCLDLNGGEPR